MVAARERIQEMGGPTKANVFTKIQLALFGEYDWNGVPTMPAEIMLLPPPFFLFNIYEVSYWSRCVIVPLLIIMDRKPIKWLPPQQSLDELWPVPREQTSLRFPRVPEPFSLARSVLEELLHRRRRRAQDLGALLAAAAAQARDRGGPAVAGGAAGGAGRAGRHLPGHGELGAGPARCSATPTTTR